VVPHRALIKKGQYLKEKYIMNIQYKLLTNENRPDFVLGIESALSQTTLIPVVVFFEPPGK
jgi:hypothetical protein